MKVTEFPTNPKFTAIKKIMEINDSNDKLLLEGLLSYYMTTKPEFNTDEENEIYSQVSMMVANYINAREQAISSLKELSKENE